MGKGGTKFVGEAKDVRSGRKRKGYSFRELKKNMAAFLSTGEHPTIQEANDRAKFDIEIVPLPTWMLSRPHVFLEFTLDSKVLGRLIIELFGDFVSALVSSFVSRCSRQSAQTVKGQEVGRLLKGFAMYVGMKESGAWIQAMNKELRHVQEGAVSVSRSGDEFLVTFSKAHALDDSHQVIGVVRDGIEVLQTLSSIKVTADDQPDGKLFISDCGQIDGQTQLRRGVFGGVDHQSSLSKQENLGQELKKVRDEIRDSIDVGMSKSLEGNENDGNVRKKRKKKFEELLLLQNDSDKEDDEGST
eukprot:TRINITY_DN24320_c0_g2_i8.p2 TRINITY_DN24320_c0_g2~~TRINITY_DN24320_c0_g2_i8.p2  ORF type:complete len:301 (-),score=61.33 TRINITY_DN24320_c0_g2_i8:317-1219(-)